VERDAPAHVETSGGPQQRGEAGRGQVVRVDVARYPVQQLPDQMANHRHVLADQVLDVTRRRRVVGRADGGGEFGRVGHVVLLAHTTGWVKPADEEDCCRRKVQGWPNSVAFQVLFARKAQVG
jgi:hypothetical protein